MTANMSFEQGGIWGSCEFGEGQCLCCRNTKRVNVEGYVEAAQKLPCWFVAPVLRIGPCNALLLPLEKP